MASDDANADLPSVPDAPEISTVQVPVPRIAITFCTKCKWNLRAAYFAQELLSTFGEALGEVSMIPSKGGIFVVDIWCQSPKTDTKIIKRTIWDRKVDGGFPETKELKKRVRDLIQPDRDLGHVDGKKKSNAEAVSRTDESQSSPLVARGENSSSSAVCEDCP